MISDRPLIGLLFVFAFCLLAPLGDALVKVVGMGAPLMVLLLSRFVFQAVSLAPVVLLSGREFPTDRRIFGLICLRSLFHILGIGMMFTALRLLPLADAIENLKYDPLAVCAVSLPQRQPARAAAAS